VRHRSIAPIVLAVPASLALAAPSGAAVHPGVQTFTAGAQCTANFVFSGADGTT
jgi:hypothetical protein